MKRLMLVLAIVTIALSSTGLASATQYKGFVEFGGMEFTERGICEGHKSWTNTGLSIEWDNKMFNWVLTGKLGGMFEPVDDDPELPQCFTHLSIESGYDLSTNEDFALSPFVKVSYSRWLRNENSKYDNSFGKLSFISGAVGIGAKYKNLYAKFGSSLPFPIKTNGDDLSGELGLNINIGVEWGRLTFDLLYEQTHFDRVQLNLCGTRVGIKF